MEERSGGSLISRRDLGPREPNDLPIGGGHFDANVREISSKLRSLTRCSFLGIFFIIMNSFIYLKSLNENVPSIDNRSFNLYVTSLTCRKYGRMEADAGGETPAHHGCAGDVRHRRG